MDGVEPLSAKVGAAKPVWIVGRRDSDAGDVVWGDVGLMCAVAGTPVARVCVWELWWGILKRSSLRVFNPPPAAVRIPNGLGLRLLKLPIGLANPLLRPMTSKLMVAGETIATWSPASLSSKLVRTEAALSRTEGTACSSCSVPFARGILWGFCWWWCIGGEGGEIGSISLSKIAEDDECLIRPWVFNCTKFRIKSVHRCWWGRYRVWWPRTEPCVRCTQKMRRSVGTPMFLRWWS